MPEVEEVVPVKGEKTMKERLQELTPDEKTKLKEQWDSSDQKLVDMGKALLQYEMLVRAEQARPDLSDEIKYARGLVIGYLKSFGSDSVQRDAAKQSAEDYYNQLKGQGKTH